MREGGSGGQRGSKGEGGTGMNRHMDMEVHDGRVGEVIKKKWTVDIRATEMKNVSNGLYLHVIRHDQKDQPMRLPCCRCGGP